MYFLLKTKSYTTDVKGKLFMKRTSLYLCSPYLNTCKEFNIFRRFACLLLITVVWIQWGFIALGKVILVWNHSQHFVLSFLMMLTLFLWPALFRVDHWKLCFFFFLWVVINIKLDTPRQLAVPFPGAFFLSQLQVFRSLFLLLWWELAVVCFLWWVADSTEPSVCQREAGLVLFYL